MAVAEASKKEVAAAAVVTVSSFEEVDVECGLMVHHS